MPPRRRAAVVFLSLLLAMAAAPLHAAENTIATIIAYHEVDDDVTHATIPRAGRDTTPQEQRRYTVSTSGFEQQLQVLRDGHYNVIPLSQLVDYLNGTVESLPPRAVVITIDDGWLCSYTNMLPLLHARGLPFTLFAYPAIIDKHGAHAVTWPQLHTLSDVEGAEVGGHAYTHSMLSRAHNPAAAANYSAFLQHELDDSRKLIEQKTGKHVRFLAYPFGDYDREVAAAASSYGYAAAVTTHRGRVTKTTPLMELPRFLVHNDTTIEEFRTFLP
jgi:peptidoglycan/xylan/chitin deacetylase (PgdA/CDA1 family)